MNVDNSGDVVDRARRRGRNGLRIDLGSSGNGLNIPV